MKPQDSPARPWSRLDFLLPAAILLFAAALRFQGFAWGLPYQLHPDEPVVFLAAQHLYRTGSLEGMAYQEVYRTAIGYPPLYIRCLGAQQALLDLLGQTPDGQMVYFAVARVINVLVGVAIVALAYRLAAELADRGVAALAAAFVASQPTLIDHARYATADTPVTALILLSLALALRAYERRDAWLAQGAIVCGLLAVTTKYHAAPVLAVALYVLAWSQWGSRRRLALHLALAALFVAGTFGLLFTHFHMLELFNAPGQPTKSLLDKGNPLMPIGLQGNLAALVEAVGWLALAPALAGLAQIANGKWQISKAVLVLAFVVLFILQLSMFRFDNIRQLLSIIAIVGLFWGWGLRWLTTRFRGAALAGAIAAVVLLAPQTTSTIQTGWLLSQKDTRAVTADWFIANAPEGAGIAVEYDHAEFEPEYGGFPGDKRFKVIQVESLFDLTRDEYLEAGIQYLVADSRAQGRGGYFSNPTEPHFRGWTLLLLRISDENLPGPRRIIFQIE